MPKEKTVTVYEFDELSSKAKDRARAWFREGGLDYEWWDSTYEDAANIGLKLTGFDLGQGGRAEGHFTEPCKQVAEHILKDHGDKTETYEHAKEFVENEDPDDEDACERFLETLLEDYHDILMKEEEYLTSDESIDEAIRANEYEFYKDGSRVRV
jgi:hypothetical protein